MSWNAERFVDLHLKMRSKICKEVFSHIVAVIVFTGIVIISIVDVLKSDSNNPNWLPKLLAAILGICHFCLCTTAILQLKYMGIIELNPLKCKIWIYLEVYNIAATTAFIVLATRYLLPPPFHQWTGTFLLLIIYWIPLIMYKTSQICRMDELVNILDYLQDCSPKNSIRKHCYDKIDTAAALQSVCHQPSTSTATGTQPHSSVTTGNFHALNMSKPSSASSPHISYEWALINSISDALP